MKRYVILSCAVALVTAATASAFELPGAGGKVDTKKIDELIASIDEVSATLEAAEGKIDECNTTLATIAEAHGIADLMSDPAKAVELKDAVTDEEKAQLQTEAEVIQTVPDDLNAAAEKATEIAGKIPDALTDLVNQITKNPMAAAGLKDKKEKLEEGKLALEQIVTEVPGLVESATSLAATVAGLL
jgi:chromosome segregation ATPase